MISRHNISLLFVELDSSKYFSKLITKVVLGLEGFKGGVFFLLNSFTGKGPEEGPTFFAIFNSQPR